MYGLDELPGVGLVAILVNKSHFDNLNVKREA
jgi:hypothetical protein